MNPNNLPYRFRQEACREYANHISGILAEFPRVVVFSPLNVETFSCRLRDAMKSLVTYRWAFYKNLPALVQNHPYIRVAIRGSNVIAGGKQEVRAWVDANEISKGTDDSTPTTKSPLGLDVKNPDQKTLEALFYLHHARILTLPTIISFDGLLDLDKFTHTIPEWEQNYDIAIVPDGDKSYRVL